MPGPLAEAVIAVLGGDEREALLVEALRSSGARLRLAGYPPMPVAPEVVRAVDVQEAVLGADAVIAPMSNTDAEGYVKARPDPSVQLRLCEESLAALRPGTPLLIGQAKPVVRQAAERLGLVLVELAEVEEIAILNAIPTAEAAVALAMEAMKRTVHDCRAVVVGFGRCGFALGRLLYAMGAHVRVVARSPAERAWAFMLNLDAHPLEELIPSASQADAVFNTVPALILDEAVLQAMDPRTVVVDIASEPGGTDFEAARRLGLRAVHALGLPGRYAPRTAGQILARTVPELLARLLARPASRAAAARGS